jgi:hypothetical protein
MAGFQRSNFCSKVLARVLDPDPHGSAKYLPPENITLIPPQRINLKVKILSLA